MCFLVQVSMGMQSKHLRLYQPYVPRQMLTPREAQLAWWELSTKEPLSLLLFGWPLRVACDAVVVRPVIFRAFLGFAVAHFHIVRAT